MQLKAFMKAVHNMTSIPENAKAIAPSNTDNLSHPCRRIHIGGEGDLVVTMKGGQKVTFAALPAGSEKSGAFIRVWAESTATLMIAEW